MMKVLIPTDFSIESKFAIQYAIKHYTKFDIPCEIILMNAYMAAYDKGVDPISENDKEKKKSKNLLDRELKKYDQLPKNTKISFKLISHMGSLTNIIPKLINERNINMVIMGKNGGKHVAEVMNILKRTKSDCPLLTVFN